MFNIVFCLITILSHGLEYCLPFYKWEAWGSKKLNNFLKGHIVSSRVRIWTQVFVFFFPKPLEWGFSGSPVIRTQHFHCWGPGSIPSRGTKISHAAQHSQKRKKKKLLSRILLLFPSLRLPSDSLPPRAHIWQYIVGEDLNSPIHQPSLTAPSAEMGKGKTRSTWKLENTRELNPWS